MQQLRSSLGTGAVSVSAGQTARGRPSPLANGDKTARDRFAAVPFCVSELGQDCDRPVCGGSVLRGGGRQREAPFLANAHRTFGLEHLEYGCCASSPKKTGRLTRGLGANQTSSRTLRGPGGFIAYRILVQLHLANLGEEPL